jgi:2-polyprenyl-3-methyl-5-hydroxy-6-metoxy-1,4-benzoquinol methylase
MTEIRDYGYARRNSRSVGADSMESSLFWEARARRFAAVGRGLQAVCSYGMPAFYNRAIDMTQRRALKHLMESIRPGDRVLEYGCGVGRWTEEMARRGAFVTAVDFSATMVNEAERRVRAAGFGDRCRFLRADIAAFESAERYDLIVGVTVLQHVLDEERLAATFARLAAHLAPAGRLVIMEAAPSTDLKRCDTATFHARTLEHYIAKIRAAGLTIVQVRGVDPVPFKLWVVPAFRVWPRVLAITALALVTLISLPMDLLLGGLLTRHSWHKIVVATNIPDA